MDQFPGFPGGWILDGNGFELVGKAAIVERNLVAIHLFLGKLRRAEDEGAVSFDPGELGLVDTELEEWSLFSEVVAEFESFGGGGLRAKHLRGIDSNQVLSVPDSVVVSAFGVLLFEETWKLMVGQQRDFEVEMSAFF